MTREDHELLAELARLNNDAAPLALRVMEGSASAVEQHDYAKRLIAAGRRLQRRADRAAEIIDGEPADLGGDTREVDSSVVQRER